MKQTIFYMILEFLLDFHHVEYRQKLKDYINKIISNEEKNDRRVILDNKKWVGYSKESKWQIKITLFLNIARISQRY